MLRITLFKFITIAAFIFAFSVFTLAQEAEQKQADRPLRITYVPQAGYTPQARIEGISGWIQLRVTFLETGEIGDIFYVKESDPDKSLTKYGLLKNAYEAAKKVKFSPAIKDGKAVTVTKILVYSFEMGRRPQFQVKRP
jgi:outer membrane biosynthesis protein TonB